MEELQRRFQIAIELMEDHDGISYWPTLIGIDQPIHDYLYWEFYEQGGKIAVVKEHWKAIWLNVVKQPQAPIAL